MNSVSQQAHVEDAVSLLESKNNVQVAKPSSTKGSTCRSNTRPEGSRRQAMHHPSLIPRRSSLVANPSSLIPHSTVRLSYNFVTSVDLRLRQTLAWCQIVCQAYMGQFVLRIRFLQLFAGDHDRHGGLGDEIVGEGTKQNSAFERQRDAVCQKNADQANSPFESTTATGPKNDQCWLKHVNLDLLAFGSHSDRTRHTASVIICLGLLQWMTSIAMRTCSFVFLRNLMQVCEMSSTA